jgi:hypothetical protein
MPLQVFARAVHGVFAAAAAQLFLGTIGEPITEISQAHNYCGGIIVFQFFRRHAHLCGALPR